MAKSSKYLGVSWVKGRRKWQSYLGFGGTQLFLGLFNTEEEAAQVRDVKAVELYGPSVRRLNFQHIPSVPQESRAISLTRGRWAIVDDEDYATLSLYQWSVTGAGYAQRTMAKGRAVLMHREIMGFPPGEVDHINRNKLDNRRCNLRLATRGENSRNTSKRAECSSSFRGVCWSAYHGKWQVNLFVEGRLRLVGRFNSEMEAAHAFDREVIRLGLEDFTPLNFPRVG